MKRAGEEKQQGGPLQASKVDKRGLYFGESTRGPHGFTVDRGGQYLMRTGFEPSVCPIGGGGVSSPSASLGSEGLLFEGVGDDLVRRTSSGHYEPVGLERLCGRSVALLFGLGMHPKCTSFVPFLAQASSNQLSRASSLLMLSFQEEDAFCSASLCQPPGKGLARPGSRQDSQLPATYPASFSAIWLASWLAAEEYQIVEQAAGGGPPAAAWLHVMRKKFCALPGVYVQQRERAYYFGLSLFAVAAASQFYKNVNEEGGRPKVEVVYVDLDSDPQAFEESRKSMPWLSLQFSSPVRSKLIRRYGLRVEPRGRRLRVSLCASCLSVHPAGYASLPNCVVLGLPRMLVVGPRGEEMQWLPCEHESPVVLREWDYAAFRWPPAAAADSRGDSAGSSSRKETCKHSGETQEQIDWDWPLKPEVAAAWPREWERRQQHRHDENS
ncbi:hypothetical protein Efla_001781 [Eimeria flavescens]